MRRSFFVVLTYGFFVLRDFGRALSRKSVGRARLCENYQLFRSRSLARTTVNAAVLQSPLPTQNGTPFGVPSGGQLFRWILAQSARVSVAPIYEKIIGFSVRAPSHEPPLMRCFVRTPLPTQNGTPLGVPSGGRWRPRRLGRSQRRERFALFCFSAAACSYDPPKRRFGEHLCPRKTAPPLGCRLVGRGGFEPPKSVTSDLQSDPFGRSGICPHGGAAAKSLWSR